MSLLFCKASSRACFSVSEIGAGACCAETATANDAAKMRIAPALRSGSMEFTLRIKTYKALFVTQSFDCLQLCRVIGGKIAEKQPRRTGNGERNHDAHGRYRDAQIAGKKKLCSDWNGEANQNPDDCPSAANQECFDEKLVEDIFSWGANRLADAYFARTLFHRHQHDVHDADPADEKRNECNHEQHNRQGKRKISRRNQYRGQGLHIIFRLRRMPATQQHPNLLLHPRNVFSVSSLYVYDAKHILASISFHQGKRNNHRFGLNI